MTDALQAIRDHIGDDPARAMEALFEVQEWISKELPAGTYKATTMLCRISAATKVLLERNEELEKDLAAQLAGHRETARQSTENLLTANTAKVRVEEAEGRARKNWQLFRDLRTEITGTGPMCRDCADADGRCPSSGRPCDPDEEVRERLAEFRAAEQRVQKLEEIIRQCAAALPNGAFIAPGASIEFMEKLPAEIRMVTTVLKEQP